jgi:uncharacterized protein YcnI
MRSHDAPAATNTISAHVNAVEQASPSASSQRATLKIPQPALALVPHGWQFPK